MFPSALDNLFSPVRSLPPIRKQPTHFDLFSNLVDSAHRVNVYFGAWEKAASSLTLYQQNLEEAQELASLIRSKIAIEKQFIESCKDEQAEIESQMITPPTYRYCMEEWDVIRRIPIEALNSDHIRNLPWLKPDQVPLRTDRMDAEGIPRTPIEQQHYERYDRMRLRRLSIIREKKQHHGNVRQYRQEIRDLGIATIRSDIEQIRAAKSEISRNVYSLRDTLLQHLKEYSDFIQDKGPLQEVIQVSKHTIHRAIHLLIQPPSIPFWPPLSSSEKTTLRTRLGGLVKEPEILMALEKDKDQISQEIHLP